MSRAAGSPSCRRPDPPWDPVTWGGEGMRGTLGRNDSCNQLRDLSESWEPCVGEKLSRMRMTISNGLKLRKRRGWGGERRMQGGENPVEPKNCRCGNPGLRPALPVALTSLIEWSFLLQQACQLLANSEPVSLLQKAREYTHSGWCRKLPCPQNFPPFFPWVGVLFSNHPCSGLSLNSEYWVHYKDLRCHT